MVVVGAVDASGGMGRVADMDDEGILRVDDAESFTPTPVPSEAIDVLARVIAEELHVNRAGTIARRIVLPMEVSEERISWMR